MSPPFHVVKAIQMDLLSCPLPQPSPLHLSVSVPLHRHCNLRTAKGEEHNRDTMSRPEAERAFPLHQRFFNQAQLCILHDVLQNINVWNIYFCKSMVV
jgi:hypothetical protein